MHLNAADLQRFYHATRLGQVASQAIAAAIRALWPNVRGANMAGFGFAAPFLDAFADEAQRVIFLMPDRQGARRWPEQAANRAVLVEERNWPINAGYFDRIVVAHGLETSERPGTLLEEINRALAPGGRAIFITPNRTGLWARRDATPFGHGRPYSIGQLERQLETHGFAPERTAAALYAAPSHRAFWLRLAGAAERAGRRLDAQRLAGAILIETTKLAFAAPRNGAGAEARNRLEVFEGLKAPPKPATGRAAARAVTASRPPRSAARRSR